MTAETPYLSDGATPEGVVALEPAGRFMRLFMRQVTGTIFQDIPFRPFLLAADPDLLGPWRREASCRQLKGSGQLQWLVSAPGWHEWCRMRDHLARQEADGSWYAIADMRQQFLALSGIRCFTGLAEADVTVLCLALDHDIHGTGGSCRGITVAWSDGAGLERQLDSADCGDAGLLTQLAEVVGTLDPDLIIGSRLHDLVLPTLRRIAAEQSDALRWGRNGAAVTLTELHGHSPQHEIYGRTVIDLSPLYRHSILEETETLAPAAGMPPMDRVRHDLRHWRRLSPIWFELPRSLPSTVHAALTRPATSAIKTCLIHACLSDSRSVPAPPPRHAPAQGPDTGRLMQPGRAAPVLCCDLALLKPAVMLAYRKGPAEDQHEYLLSQLADWFAAERRDGQGGQMPSPQLCRYLLPAFFRMLAGNTPFGDHETAREVVRLSEVISRDLLDCAKEWGADPVAVHGDEIYLHLPATGSSGTLTDLLQQRLSRLLPGFGQICRTRPYRAMFSYRAGSFALLQQDGAVAYRGTLITARSMEPYLKEFLAEAAELLLHDRATEIRQLYRRYAARLTGKECPLHWVTRTEKLVDSPEQYRAAVLRGGRNRAAVYELAARYPGRWRQGDRISYYVTGSGRQVAAHEQCKPVEEFDHRHPDINGAWYVERLRQVVKRLESFLPAEPMLFQ